uniref:Uncharacterized protein n=1 Tax=Trypanosoma vivax (strain Y486) TaxID=1055687 RepID=G0U3X8_TRYVY|nr:conserved hypothetical protein [Trypanosoma vivax Y486]
MNLKRFTHFWSSRIKKSATTGRSSSGGSSSSRSSSTSSSSSGDGGSGNNVGADEEESGSSISVGSSSGSWTRKFPFASLNVAEEEDEEEQQLHNRDHIMRAMESQTVLENVQHFVSANQMLKKSVNVLGESEIRQDRAAILSMLELCTLSFPEGVEAQGCSTTSTNRCSGISHSKSYEGCEHTELPLTLETSGSSQNDLHEQARLRGTVDPTTSDACIPSINGLELSDFTTTGRLTCEHQRSLSHALVSMALDMDLNTYTNCVNKLSRQKIHLNPINPQLMGARSELASFSAATPLCVTDISESEDATSAQSLSSTSTGGKAKPSQRSNFIMRSRSPGLDAHFDELKKAEGILKPVHSITRWVVLRTLLQCYSEDKWSSEHETDMLCGEKEAAVTKDGSIQVGKPAHVPWKQVVTVLTEVLGMRNVHAVEVIISHWLLHDHAGRELVQCFLQRPFAMTLGPGCSETPVDRKEFAAQPGGLPSGAVTIEHMDRVDDAYEKCISLPWIRYLEKSLEAAPLGVGTEPEETASMAQLPICRAMMIYVMCSQQWNEDKQKQHFSVLEMLWSDHCAQANGQRGIYIPRALPRDKKKSEKGEGHACSSTFWAFSTADIGSDQTNSHTGALLTNAQQVDNVEQVLLSFLLQSTWMAALSLRTRQCLEGSTPRIIEALSCARAARKVPLASWFQKYMQDALELLAWAHLAAGNYTKALKMAGRHFDNAKRQWALRGCSCVSGVSYLKSATLLAQVQAIHGSSVSLVKSVEFALRQVTLCEQEIEKRSYFGNKKRVLRYVDARRDVYKAKLTLLQLSWFVYQTLGCTAQAKEYFDQYMHFLKHQQLEGRFLKEYIALRERGEQLLENAEYGAAVKFFKSAMECVKHFSATATRTMREGASAAIACLSNAEPPVLFNLFPTTGIGGTKFFTHNAPYETMEFDREIVLMRTETESERNVALAYIAQADHEVNIVERRQQLNNAVTSAYGAQNALHRWASKVEQPIPSPVMVEMAFCSVVAAKALLRLGQPKKAALLLEPLTEDKVNSATVLPPLWSAVLVPPNRPLTTRELLERIETIQVKLRAYDLYAQCLATFDGERSYRVVVQMRSFIEELRAWVRPLLAPLSEPEGNKYMDFVMAFVGIPAAAGILLRKLIQEAEELEVKTNITCGDSLFVLGRWEEALGEYSAALAMHDSVNSIQAASNDDDNEDDGSENNMTIKGDGANVRGEDGVLALFRATRARGRDRARNEHKIKESLLLARLAEVYSALGKQSTAIQYYRQVLEYAMDASDAILQYNARLHLARLYTATSDVVAANEQWATVSALAEAYDDQEISRETKRFIIQAQRTSRAFVSLVETARELSNLASGAEGEDALADKRFALEELAEAYLHLGQFRECLKTLDEREGVQDKGSQGKARLFNMRARALLGEDAAQDAVKVLMTWAHDARQRLNHAELGHANSMLGVVHSRMQQPFKARQGHRAALAAFAEVSDMDHDCRTAVMESARWLVHHFYLNEEKVLLCDEHKSEKVPKTMSNLGCFHLQPSSNNGVGVAENARLDVARPAVALEEAEDEEDEENFVRNDSGDLHVLMLEENERRAKWQHRALVRSRSRSGSGSGNGSFVDDRHLVREVETLASTCGSLERVACGSPVTGLRNSSFSGMEEKDTIRAVGSSDEVSSGGISRADSVVHLAEDNEPGVPMKNRSGATVSMCGSSLAPQISSSVTPAAWSFCKQPASSCQRGSTNAEIYDEFENSRHSNGAEVQTLGFYHALEVIETATQLSLLPFSMRHRGVARSPADVVDLALFSYPQCTFVFYFAEFPMQFSAVVRPAGRNFYLKRVLQAYSLESYHMRKSSLATQQQGKVSTAAPESIPSYVEEPQSNSCMASAASEANDELAGALQDLYDDLWSPVQSALRSARCGIDEVECLVLVVDPTLLHVPFPALHNRAGNSTPLGQQFTVVVTPTVATFLHGVERSDQQMSLFDAPQSCRCMFLSERSPAVEPPAHPEPAPKAATSLLNAPIAAVSSRISSAMRRSSVSVTEERCQPVQDQNACRIFIAPSNPCPWTIFYGCTRKELISAFDIDSCKVLMLLCDPVEGMFKVADGVVRLLDFVRGKDSLADTIELVVITADRAQTVGIDEPGASARLCLSHGCRRVLRVDLASGTSITSAHLQFLHLYFEKLRTVLQWRLRYPYALALRMAQRDAQHSSLSSKVCAAFTLVGAA